MGFSDAAVKQVEKVTSEAEVHTLDRALVAISVALDVGDSLPVVPLALACASTPMKSKPCASCTT